MKNRNVCRKKRQNRTVHVDFQDESTYHRLIEDGSSFVEFVVAYVLSIGFQFAHKCHCSGQSWFHRHSHYGGIRLEGLCIWRIQCCECKVVFTILPHFVQKVSFDVCECWRKSPYCYFWRVEFGKDFINLEHLTNGYLEVTHFNRKSPCSPNSSENPTCSTFLLPSR